MVCHTLLRNTLFLGAFFPQNHETTSVFQHDRPSLHNNSPSKILPIHAVVHLRLCHPLYATWLDAWRLATCIHCCAADWFHVDLVCLAVVESTLAHGFFKRAFDTRFCHRNKLMVSFQVAPFYGTSSMDIQWPQHIGCHWLDNYFRAPYITQKLVEFHSECALICIRESPCVSKSWPVSFWMHKN